jgi:hydrogenase maturation protease
MGAAPGHVACFDGEAMDRQLGKAGRSVHEVGLADVLDMLRLTGQLPDHRALVGIEPGRVDWGESLSPAVEAAVPRAASLALEWLVRAREAAAALPGSASGPPVAEAAAR